MVKPTLIVFFLSVHFSGLYSTGLNTSSKLSAIIERLKKNEIVYVVDDVHVIHTTAPPKAQNDTKKPTESIAKQRKIRQVMSDSDTLWKYGVIPYTIEASTIGEYHRTIRKAMRHWESDSCIQFVEKRPNEDNYMEIKTSEATGCDSEVGMVKGPQTVNLNPKRCSFGSIVHELAHSLGFYHEHMRPDRDKFIEVQSSNIVPGFADQFEKAPETEVTNMGDVHSFDIGSIMEYPKNAFAIKGKESIKPLVASPSVKQMGQREGLSPIDKRKANKLYKCPICGATLLDREGVIRSEEQSSDGMYCEYRILASHGDRIQLVFMLIDLPSSQPCEKDYVYLRDGYEEKPGLHVSFCGRETPTSTFLSGGNRLIIDYRLTNQSKPYRGFVAAYKMICGGIIEKDDGTLESSNYPFEYPANQNCTWIIRVDPEKKAAIEFNYLQMTKCPDAYVYILDGDHKSVLGRLEGNKTGEMKFVSSTNEIAVDFVSGLSSCQGFTSRFYAVNKTVASSKPMSSATGKKTDKDRDLNKVIEELIQSSLLGQDKFDTSPRDTPKSKELGLLEQLIRSSILDGK